MSKKIYMDEIPGGAMAAKGKKDREYRRMRN